MITIEHLEVMFKTERRRDEQVFADLFVRHIDRHEAERRHQEDRDRRATVERSVTGGGESW